MDEHECPATVQTSPKRDCTVSNTEPGADDIITRQARRDTLHKAVRGPGDTLETTLEVGPALGDGLPAAQKPTAQGAIDLAETDRAESAQGVAQVAPGTPPDAPTDVKSSTEEHGSVLTTLPKRYRSISSAEPSADDIITRQARRYTLHKDVRAPHTALPTAVATEPSHTAVGARSSITTSNTESRAKRDRTDSMFAADANNASLPPTCLQRANTEHRDVRQDRQRADLQVQLSMAHFFSSLKSSVRPAEDQPGDHDSRASISSISSLASFASDDGKPTTLIGWLDAVRGEIFDVPANGSCMYFALYGVKAPRFNTDKMGLSKISSREANFYRSRVAATLAAKFDGWSDSGLFDIARLALRYMIEGQNEVELSKAVKKQIVAAGREDCSKTWTRRWWTGREELMAAAAFLHVPLVVLDVMDDGAACMQVYVPDYLRPKLPNSIEVVKTHLLQPQRAFQTLRTLLESWVIPLILVLTHNEGSGHFQALRVNGEYYVEWSKTEANGEDMRDRLEAALVRANIPGVSRYLPPLHQPRAATESYSEYELSGSTTSQASDSYKAGCSSSSGVILSQLTTLSSDDIPASTSSSYFDCKATAATLSGLPSLEQTAPSGHEELLCEVTAEMSKRGEQSQVDYSSLAGRGSNRWLEAAAAARSIGVTQGGGGGRKSHDLEGTSGSDDATVGRHGARAPSPTPLPGATRQSDPDQDREGAHLLGRTAHARHDHREDGQHERQGDSLRMVRLHRRVNGTGTVATVHA